ncbi:MAG: aminotransferase class I/II-fold pyridoxal phosphate-dependent enzyme [Steroidobacteraceae bacterium]
MDIDTFLLERNQTLFENDVDCNLTESGVHPFSIRELLPDEAIDSLLQLRLGYGYTEGRPALREAIASWYPGAELRNVAVAHGTSEANLLSVLTVLAPGDEVLVLLPNFMQLPGLLRAFGVHVRTHELTEANQWQPDPVALEASLGERTRMIALANPNNPTGQVLTPQSMQALVRIARSRGLYLLADEIYRGAEIDCSETPTFFGHYERVIVTSSLSKAFGLPGLRLGWIVAAPDVVNQVMRRQDYTSIGTGILSQMIAERVLRPANRVQILERGRGVLSTNVRVLEAWLQEHCDVLSCRRPQAGAVAFVRYLFPMASEELSTGLRETESVFVVAGSWFGIDGYVRIGIGGEQNDLHTGLTRISSFLARLRHTHAVRA